MSIVPPPPSMPHETTDPASPVQDATVPDKSIAPGEMVAPDLGPAAERAAPYVARILQQHLCDDPSTRYWTADGSAVFVDISGFTKLSERLARKGREGAEQITEAIGSSFEAILHVAYDNGGSLLKFGGDALLMWFEGEAHAKRACRATVLMRRVLRDVGRIEVPGAKVTLRMTQGVHTGCFHFFAVGTSHFEFLPVGPSWTQLVAMEHGAEAGEIMVSPETAAQLPSRCLGESRGPGLLLVREPPGQAEKLPLVPRPKVPAATIAHCLSTAVRAHVLAGGGASEHRPVTIAFIHFDGTDTLIEQHGPAAAAEALHRLLNAVQAAADEQRVSFLASDVDADGGKLILTSGAPKATGDDEERMLLALRRIADTELPIAIRIGVNRGSVFAGDIGPFYRRTYTVMGDAVNLAARLMAKAEPGLIYATADVLDRSSTIFETTELAPFAVKGKAKPIQAWSVGRAQGSRKRHIALQRLPLVGRDAEIALIREALACARSGAGRLIEIVGEAGIGKTRLLETLRDDAAGFRRLHASGEAYTASTPYAVWRELLRELLAIGREDPDAVVVDRLRDAVATHAPDLAPWLPLIAIAFGVDVPPTPEVEMLAENNRRPKLHEAVDRFLEVMVHDPLLVELEDAHQMDEASAELLSYLTERIDVRPWLIGVARRPSESELTAPESPAVSRIELKPLTPQDAVRMVQLATTQHPLHMHVIEVVAQRSGGNPQFLRDLLNSAINSGGVEGLPDSAEAAAIARIDGLAPEDRALVRRAAVLGQKFHPRMLSWLDAGGDAAQPEPATWVRLRDLFAEEADGYLRFRRSLLRDAAYEGLPYKLRRRLHRTVAERLQEELEQPEESAGLLSLHYFEAGEYFSAWRYAAIAAKHADAAFAHIEAAGLYARAVEAGKRLPAVPKPELGRVCDALGDAWRRASEYDKASAAFQMARRMNVDGDSLLDAGLLLKHSMIEERLGQYPKALRWAARARRALEGRTDNDALRQIARIDGWYATVRQREGKTHDAVKWAEKAVSEAQLVEDHDSLGAAYLVLGWVSAAQGSPDAERYNMLALESSKRAGNLVRQAVLLVNIGVTCAWEGRWDEALQYFERARDENVHIGNAANAVLASLNIAEILLDQGRSDEAELILKETLPFCRAAKHRFLLGACLEHLGRVSLVGGRLDEALERLENAKAMFQRVHAMDDIPSIDARIAECYVHLGRTHLALDLIAGMLANVGSSQAIAKLKPQLLRIRALALSLEGSHEEARKSLEASVQAARSLKDLFQLAMSLHMLVEIDRRHGVTPLPANVQEAEELVAKFNVRQIPRIPEHIDQGAAA